MIIYYSVYDNDFYDVLRSFAKDLWPSIVEGYPLGYDSMPKPTDLDGHKAYFDADLLHRKYVKEYYDDRVSEEGKAYFLACVKSLFAKHVQNNECRDYLIDEFKATIEQEVTDSWQNSEAFYYFTSTNQVLNF